MSTILSLLTFVFNEFLNTKYAKAYTKDTKDLMALLSPIVNN